MSGTPESAEEAHRQAALAAATSSAADDQAWVDDIAQFNDEDFDPQSVFAAGADDAHDQAFADPGYAQLAEEFNSEPAHAERRAARDRYAHRAPRPIIPMGDGPDAGELLRGMRDKERY